VEGVIPGGRNLLLEFVRSWIGERQMGLIWLLFVVAYTTGIPEVETLCAIANVTEGSRIDPRKFWS
jgi:hypothetical protein